MLVLKILKRIILIPIWFLVTIVHFLIKLAIEVFCIGKGLASLILGFMLLGTLIWYREWIRFAILAAASGILLIFLWTGVFLEVMIETVKEKIEELIIL